MAGLQIFVEEFISQWVKNCIQQTGIRKVALGGGFFMNRRLIRSSRIR